MAEEEGYGSGLWGSSQYGIGTIPPAPPLPTITPIDPVDGASGIAQLKPICFRLESLGVIDIGTLLVAVDGLNWMVGGVEQNGAVAVASSNGLGGYDVQITPPAPYAIGSRQEVSIYVLDTSGGESLLVYFFTVGIGPRLIKVANPIEGLLLANFNQPMLLDGTFFFKENWVITPISDGAAPLEITEVFASESQANVAHLRYIGGGSTYSLKANGVLGEDGSPIEDGFDSVEFEIVFGKEEEPTVKIFNSVFGPMGVSQRSRTRRTIDEFTANRAIALALDEQFRLRFQQLDNTVGRDGRDGKRRT